MKAFQRQVPNWFRADQRFDKLEEPARDQNLAMLRFATETSRKISDCANRCVVLASFKSDHTQGGIACGDADSCAKIDASMFPLSAQFGHSIAHGQGHAHRRPALPRLDH